MTRKNKKIYTEQMDAIWEYMNYHGEPTGYTEGYTIDIEGGHDGYYMSMYDNSIINEEAYEDSFLERMLYTLKKGLNAASHISHNSILRLVDELIISTLREQIAIEGNEVYFLNDLYEYFSNKPLGLIRYE
tara:strand:- start:158 stop:550 length:393 start_codon:yes stop_codon:yes gene_type:complete